MSILKTLTKCYIATLRALVRLLFLFMVLQYFLFACKGESEDPFALGFRKGNGHGTVDWLWRRTLTGRNSEMLAPMFFLHTTRCLRSFELVGSSRWENVAFYALLSST